MKKLSDFINLYQVSKTLRFELIPQGATRNNLNAIIEEDEERAENYKKVKAIIDNYHKFFIEESLKSCSMNVHDRGNSNSLEEFVSYYSILKRTDSQEAIFEKIKKELRKQIIKSVKENKLNEVLIDKEAEMLISSSDKESMDDDEQKTSSKAPYVRLFGKELIKDLLFFVESDSEKELIDKFDGFTTYFSDFHENRKNIYSEDEKSTSIAYRLINQNLPKFIDNARSFDKISQSDVVEKFAEIQRDFDFCLNGSDISELFTISYYNNTLTQKQIDVYNTIIGGRKEEGKKIKIAGINEYVNLYNQEQKDKCNRLPFLKPLFKQILSDRESLSWLPESFERDADLIESVNLGYRKIFDNVLSCNNSLLTFLNSINEYELRSIYISSGSFGILSHAIFGDWSVIDRAISDDYVRNNPCRKEKDLEKYIKSIKYLSIEAINNCLFAYGKEERVESRFFNEDISTVFDNIEQCYTQVFDLLNRPYPSEKNLIQDVDSVDKIKKLLDSLKVLQNFIKPLACDLSEKDEKFYGIFVPMWDLLNALLNPLYDKVRNYLTRKPYSLEKIKLNFGRATLLNGWDLNKERDNLSVILRKDGLYYLAIMNKASNTLFTSENIPSTGECYEKMEYKLLPSPYLMLPKVFFSKTRRSFFQPSEQLLEIYEKGSCKKGSDFNIDDCHQLIDFFKTSINKHDDWSIFGFKFTPTKDYRDLNDFYNEVDNQGYSLKFRDVSVDYIDKLVSEGKLYLFKIYNKDFSPYSKGTPNMHTLYWKALFDENNLKDVVYKLNGQAEIFYRKKSIVYSDEIMGKGHHYEKLKDKFDYPIIKDRRFAFDKFQFHVPIALNFKSKNISNINSMVCQFIKEEAVKHVIGIDRGERHLLYLTVTDLNGVIKEQFSLNTITNDYGTKDYHERLVEREALRDNERKNWKSIDDIRQLKEGYLSQVVHKIAQLIVKYNAIVVLEDLNMGFKRGRQKVERQVYQKFEKMLIDKLNYLVDKQKAIDQDGGLLKAYQLTNEFKSFQKLGKHSGFLFYIPAWCTSKMDPTTGFVNMLDTRYESIIKTKEFVNKFDYIRYNKKDNRFEFGLDYAKFNTKSDGTRTKWVVCSYGDRIEVFRNPDANNQWDNRKIDLTNEFKLLLEQYDIPINEDIKLAIANFSEQKKDLFERFMYLLRLTLQMRNSSSRTGEDYIISPVQNVKGDFYDSRYCGNDLPKDADANGAYNIARKGIWVISQIKNTKNTDKPKIAISNKEWLSFAQSFDK